MALIAGTVDVTMVTLLWKYYIKKFNLAPFVRMAKQFASQNGLKSQVVQHATRQKEQNKETKEKFVKGAIQSLPMGQLLQNVMDSQGISGEEIFGLLQDQDFMKGIMVMVNTFGGVVKKLSGKSGDKEEPKYADLVSYQ